MEVFTGLRRPLAPQDLMPLQQFMNKNVKTLRKRQATGTTHLQDAEGNTTTVIRAYSAETNMARCGLAPLFLAPDQAHYVAVLARQKAEPP